MSTVGAHLHRTVPSAAADPAKHERERTRKATPPSTQPVPAHLLSHRRHFQLQLLPRVTRRLQLLLQRVGRVARL